MPKLPPGAFCEACGRKPRPESVDEDGRHTALVRNSAWTDNACNGRILNADGSPYRPPKDRCGDCPACEAGRGPARNAKGACPKCGHHSCAAVSAEAVG